MDAVSDAPRPRGRPRADDATTLHTDQLLDAALEHFAARGFDAASMRELARDLGVSHNLIPQRVGNKETLWFAAVDHGFADLATELSETFGPPSDASTIDATPDTDTLRALVIRFVEANTRRPALARIINQEAVAPGPRLDHIFTAYIEPVQRFGEQVLDALVDRGETSPASVALFYFLMTHGAAGPAMYPALAARLGATVDPDDPEAVRRHATAAADWLFDGLRTR